MQTIIYLRIAVYSYLDANGAKSPVVILVYCKSDEDILFDDYSSKY